MATNQFVVKHGLISKDDVQVTGSVTASLGFYGTASNAITAAFCNNANFANVASVANLASTASFALNAAGSSLISGAIYNITASWANNFLQFDQYINSVSVLLHFDGINGQTTTSDSSENNFPVTMSNMILSSGNPKFGPTSLTQSVTGSIIGSQSLLSVTTSSKFESAANEDLTVEGFYRFDFVDADAVLWTTIGASGSAGGVNMGQVAYLASGSGNFANASTTGSVIWQLNSPGNILRTPEMVMVGPQWYHFAFVRSSSVGNNCSIYINGQLEASASYTGSFTSTGPLCLSNFSQSNNFSYSLYGGVDEFRWTKGVARYSGNFNAPAAPFPSFGPNSGSYAISSHVADTSSYSVFANSASFSVSASNAISAAWAPPIPSASSSFASSAISSSFALAAHLADSASYSTNALSASFALTAHLSDSSSFASAAHLADSASYSTNNLTSSFALTAHLSDSASFSTKNISSSFALNAASADSASFSTRNISSSFALSAAAADSASYSTSNLSSSYALTALSAAFAPGSPTATASFANFATSASFAIASHFADSSSFATQSTSASYAFHATNADTSSYALFAADMSGDPYFTSVSVLLHFDGISGSNTTVDSGPNNFSVSMSNYLLTDNNPKFGTTCMTASTTTVTRLNSVTNTLFDAAANEPITIEGWYRFSQLTLDGVLFTTCISGGTDQGTVAYSINDGTIFWQLGPSRTLQTAGVITASATNWYHLAFVRNGTATNNCTIYVNGVARATTSDNGAVTGTGPMCIGNFAGNTNSGFDLLGGVDEFRWTKNVARYFGNFTTASSPFAGAVIVNSASFASTASYLNRLNQPSVIITGSTQFPLIVTNNLNNESEIINSNLNGGATASADVVCFNDLGSAASYQGVYDIDMGINSSGYSYPFIGGPNDAYLFNTGSQSSSLFIGNIDTTGSVRIFAGNFMNTGSGFNIYSQSITSSIPILGTASYATTGQTASYIASTNIDKVFYYHESYDFLQATTASGQIDGCWSYNTGTLKTGAPEFNHPGILWLSASQILNQINTFTNFGPSNVPSASVQLGNVISASFIMALSTGSYQYAVRFGLFDDITTETPANGIYFEKTGSPIGTFNTASQQLNNWIGVVRTGSISRTITSSIASTASLAWHKFSIATSGNPTNGMTASFFIDGTLAGVITSSLTGSLPCVYGLQHNQKATIATTGSAFATKIDYIEILGSCIR